MPSFSEKSKIKLQSCDKELQRLFNKVVECYDCTILDGYRGEERQNELFSQGRSKVKFPNSKHNKYPSKAIDVAPYPVDWNDLRRFYHFAGYVRGVAENLGIRIRWGGDWDGDFEIKDNNFNDLPHFELIE
jgi:hypothetical protein